MTKRTSAYIVGRNLAKARAALGLSQLELVDRYLSAYNQLPEHEQRAARKLDNSALSHIENSEIGDKHSKVKIKTAELLTGLLAIEPELLYQTKPIINDISPSIAPAPNVPINFDTPLTESLLAALPNSARFVGLPADMDAVDLPYISLLNRSAFAQLCGEPPSSPHFNCRRIYRHGIELSMFTDRAIFEVNGDSMEPYIHSGDEVLAYRIDPDQWQTVQNCIVVVAYANTLTIKKVIENELGQRSIITLRPYRAELAALTVRQNEIRSIYRVEKIMPRSFEAMI